MYNVNWDSKIITIPQVDLVDLGNGVYKLDLELCHQELRRLEWEFFEGLSRPQILEYTLPKLAGGVIYAAFVILINDYWIEFEDGQYAVNFDGANTNIQDYTVVNQVSIRPNNSAGLQDLSTLLASAYGGRVVIDMDRGQAGTSTPIGTLATPSNNVIDAVTIAHKQGIGELYFIGHYDISDNVDSLVIKGQNAVLTSLNILNEANVKNCQIVDATVSGILDGGTLMERCMADGISYVNGIMSLTSLTIEPIVLGGSQQAIFLDCKSAVGGTDTPTIDMGGSGQALAIRGWEGGIRITNRTANDPCSIDMNSGHVIVDGSCTGSPITLRGVFKLTVEAGATVPNTDGRVMMQSDIDNIANEVLNKDVVCP